MTIESCLNEALITIKTSAIIVSVVLIIVVALLIVLIKRKDKSGIKYGIILILLILSIYSYNILPLIIDYCNKDIIIDTGYYYLQGGEGIYEGDYLVGGSMDVELENNGEMVLTSADGYPTGEHYGKIAYGKHSKKILGFEELDENH